MKINLLRRHLLLCLLSVFTIVSCSSKDEDDDPTPGSENPSPADVEAIVQSGTWKITRFEDSGEDELHHFEDYTFTFGQDGKLVATNGTNTYNGTWSITDSDSGDDDDDDSNSDDLDFNINFNLSNEFEDLNDDWDITSHSASKIELVDISGGNGGTDYLTFEKS